MNNELIESLIIVSEQKPLTVFPNAWPTSAVYDMRTFSDLRPGTLISQFREYRTARGSEKGVGVIPSLNKPVVEPPVLIFPGVPRPIGLVFALRRPVTSAPNKGWRQGGRRKTVAYQMTCS